MKILKKLCKKFMNSKTAQPAQTRTKSQIMFHKKVHRRTLITNIKSGSEYELLCSLKAFFYSSCHSNNTSFYSKLEILQPQPISKNTTKGILKFICVLELPSSSKERGNSMAIQVVEFSNGGCKIRKIFD